MKTIKQIEEEFDKKFPVQRCEYCDGDNDGVHIPPCTCAINRAIYEEQEKHKSFIKQKISEIMDECIGNKRDDSLSSHSAEDLFASANAIGYNQKRQELIQLKYEKTT